MAAVIDHILWATPDLEYGEKTIENITGIKTARGGSHPGRGTRNSLISLGDNVYLEIIAPDPAQSLEGNLGELLSDLPWPGIYTYAVRHNDLESRAKHAEALGLHIEGPVERHRLQPDGARLDWKLLYTHHPAFGVQIPFAIDWLETPHPSVSNPKGAILKEFHVLHPDAASLSGLYRELEISISVRGASKPGFLAVLETPKGEVVLQNPG